VTVQVKRPDVAGLTEALVCRDEARRETLVAEADGGDAPFAYLYAVRTAPLAAAGETLEVYIRMVGGPWCEPEGGDPHDCCNWQAVTLDGRGSGTAEDEVASPQCQ